MAVLVMGGILTGTLMGEPLVCVNDARVAIRHDDNASRSGTNFTQIFMF